MSKSVEKAVEILMVIADSKNGVTLSEVVRATDLPKTSVFNILRSLERKRVIYRREDFLTYSIGFVAYSIGNAYSRTSHLILNSRSFCEDLSIKVGKSVLIGKLQKDKIFYVYKNHHEGELINSPNVGELVDISKSALGEVFNAYGTNGEGDAKVRAQAQKSLEKGYAILNLDQTSSIFSIAAPVFNFENFLSGGIEFIGYYENQSDLNSDIDDLIATAKDISKNMGYVEETGKSEAFS